MNNTPHTFHIPVMGTGYTIDTPIKVAHYGISSVVSIIDHRLIEQMRAFHSEAYHYPYSLIKEKEEDSRAKRITAYLDLMDDIVRTKFEALKNTPFEPGSEITKYFEMLPDTSSLKDQYKEMLKTEGETRKIRQAQLREQMVPGAIDVNVMTKVDRANYLKNKAPLPTEFNDAHAALRGFANSKLESSVVLSAGLNPRLYGYMAAFEDFFPDKKGRLKKKIIIKVSDYRSALIQGKFLAKKGLWVSEFRIESGLNCGGHAFATDGYLMGPILEEFKKNKEQLLSTLFEIYSAALEKQEKAAPVEPPQLKVTAQGGIGTAVEHQFLLDYYNIDSIGWGSPFLLVPEAVNIDDGSIDLLCKAKEEDYYLSNVSPLGVPFNTVKGNTAELEKQERIENGKPGAPCLKKHLAFNNEFTEEPICVASKQYQQKKIKELKKEIADEETFRDSVNKIVEKMCLCIGLGNSLLIKNNMPMYKGLKGITICPGPNLAYFSKTVSLREMIDHIYGRIDILKKEDRPSMFIKELKIYIDYLKSKLNESAGQLNEAQTKYFQSFQSNLNEGIRYYENLFSNARPWFEDIKANILNDLNKLRRELNGIEMGMR